MIYQVNRGQMFKQGIFVNILRPDSKDWKTAVENLQRFSSLDHIELWLERIPKGRELKDIRAAFRNVQLIVHGPFLHTSLVSHIPAIVDVTEKRFEATIEFASKLQAHVVTFHAGTYPMFESREEVLGKLASRFERFSRLQDPIATLENMPVNGHGTTKQAIGQLSDYDQILELLPNLRFTLDIGHCLQNEDDFVSFLKKHVSRIENIHLHDGIPRGRGHLRLGNGALDLNSFLDALMAVSYDKYVGVETISLGDTQSSWETLCEAESRRGIRDSESTSHREVTLGGRHRLTHS